MQLQISSIQVKNPSVNSQMVEAAFEAACNIYYNYLKKQNKKHKITIW